MNKATISRFMIMMLVSILALIVSQAQQNEYDLTNTPTNFALSNWYACNYGDYQPACDAIGDDTPSQVSIANVNSNALSNWYACTYGDYQPACNAIGEDTPSRVSIANVNSNALSNWYACTYGDYQPACDAT